MATPSQRGTTLKVQSAPTFSNFIVVDGTWQPKDATQVTETLGGDSRTANWTFWNPGLNIDTDWVIVSGSTPARIGDLVGAANGSVTFLVLKADDSELGGRPYKQSISLVVRESVTL